MITPGRLDLAADRWVACIRALSFVGLDFTSATFRAQVRLTPDAAGSPLVSLATVSTAAAEGVRLIGVTTDTISNHISAGRLPSVPQGYAGTDSVVLSQVGIRINKATMSGLPLPSQRGTDVTLAWDLLVTPPGGLEDKYLGGAFTIRAGVTQ